MRYCVCFFLFVFCCFPALRGQAPPIGQWREHLDYRPAIQVIKGDKVYCATVSNLFSIDESDAAQRYSKVTGLNDLGIACIGWDAATEQVVVAYRNSNLDILKNDITRNIGDIRRSSIPGNKFIYAIACKDGLAYLCSGLGIIVANLNKYEIKDTWFIGNNGGQVKVNGCTIAASFFYAATDEGLKRAPLTADLSVAANWTNLSGSNGLPAGPCTQVLAAGNTIIAQQKDAVYFSDNSNWLLWYTDPVWSIRNITASADKVLICQQNNAGNVRVLQLSATGTIEKKMDQAGALLAPVSAIADAGRVWVADSTAGLTRFSAAGIDRFIPNGPPGIATGDLVTNGQQLYAASGGIDEVWQGTRNRNGLARFSNNEWTFRRYDNTPALDSLEDLLPVVIDPVDGSAWVGSYGGGLVHFMEGFTRIYNSSNSTLQAAIAYPGKYRISGLAFDGEHNLWVSNYGAAQNLHVHKADSSWQAFTIPFAHTDNASGPLLVDDIGQVWIIGPKGNGLFCFNYGKSLSNTNDDRWKSYAQGSGNGNLPGNNVLCIALDKDGFIWVGTDRGIGVIQCTGDVFSARGCDAVLPVVQQDRFAGLLFRDETVQCMAVDGANRKWVGTRNGLWLLSPDGTKIIYRFTAENSPLPDNDLKKIAVDPVSGEVFIATARGICSFRSTATEGSTTNHTILVFPNPVPPGYNGTIAIRGLVNNALVKITELNGRLVYQTRALGGQAIWNGLTYTGSKVASGIYLVFVRNDAGDEKLVTKIAITGK